MQPQDMEKMFEQENQLELIGWEDGLPAIAAY